MISTSSMRPMYGSVMLARIDLVPALTFVSDTVTPRCLNMSTAAADFDATALMSNHTEFDNAFYKAHTAANRKPGEANPFDVGKAAVGRYFTMVEECTAAAKLRAAGKP